jgi:hypothetical protein
LPISKKIRIERYFLNLIKDIYEKLTVNIIVNGKRELRTCCYESFCSIFSMTLIARDRVGLGGSC